MDLKILYRGPLESCNYGCEYCPFAKKQDSRADLERDRAALERFVAWARGRRTDRLGIFFTPWGEALIRPAYQRALIELSWFDHVERAAIQTNLSANLDWLGEARRDRVALWATYHPDWSDFDEFVAKVRTLAELGVRVSVGAVGFVEFAGVIERLRAALPASVYLWINAVKSHGAAGYDADALARFAAVDPLFPINTHQHPSLGQSCRAGASVISVDGTGDIRRCHFIRDVIGNIYSPGVEDALKERPCSNATCGCHIGYVHLDHLELYDVYGSGILERIPDRALWSRPAARRELPVVG